MNSIDLSHDATPTVVEHAIANLVAESFGACAPKRGVGRIRRVDAEHGGGSAADMDSPGDELASALSPFSRESLCVAGRRS